MSLLLRLFCNFEVGLGELHPKTYEKKKKRYVYLVLENVENFQIDARDSIVVLTLWSWLLLLHLRQRFPTTFKLSVAYSTTLLRWLDYTDPNE